MSMQASDESPRVMTDNCASNFRGNQKYDAGVVYTDMVAIAYGIVLVFVAISQIDVPP